MMKRARTKLIIGTLFAVVAISAFAQNEAQPDPQLLAEIMKIKAIDNHTHVSKVVSAGEKDTEFDALPCDPLEPSPVAVMGRPENPEYLAAWKALWHYRWNDAAPEHVKEILSAKKAKKKELGDKYPAWVIDHWNTQIMFANRVAMGPGLTAPRFRWVPFDDALMYPLNNKGMAINPDRVFFFSREEMLLKRYMSEAGVKAMPTTLDDYLKKVVTATLEKQKAAGTPAIKFEAAYLRALDFGPATEEEAQAAYSQYASSGAQPDPASYRKLQDYLFEYIAAEAGRLGMAVHLHTGTGCGGYFKLAGANPLNMEWVMTDPALRKTNFVLIHGGVPFTKEMAFELGKPNVYTDFSEMTALLSVRALAENIRYWLELYPEKVLYGTDLSPGDGATDWEENGWLTNDVGRRALTLALTGMMHDGEITRARALELGHMALHDNAAKLYGLP